MVKICRLEPEWRATGGRVDVDTGQHFKDAIIWWDGALDWDWKMCGTSHRTGITERAAQAIVALGATHVVVSLGMDNNIAFPSLAVVDIFARNHIEFYALPTVAASSIYNILHDKSEFVAILLHSTC